MAKYSEFINWVIKNTLVGYSSGHPLQIPESMWTRSGSSSIIAKDEEEVFTTDRSTAYAKTTTSMIVPITTNVKIVMNGTAGGQFYIITDENNKYIKLTLIDFDSDISDGSLKTTLNLKNGLTVSKTIKHIYLACTTNTVSATGIVNSSIYTPIICESWDCDITIEPGKTATVNLEVNFTFPE